MAQTTGAMNTVDAQIEISANGTTWYDISGSTNKLEAPTQTADTGSAATLDGQYKLTKAGKLNPMELSLMILYTEVADEAFRLLETQWALAGRPLYVRWIPSRGTGNFVYTTANAAGVAASGIITQLTLPGADAETASPTLLAFRVLVTRILRSTNNPSPSLSPSASASPSPSS